MSLLFFMTLVVFSQHILVTSPAKPHKIRLFWRLRYLVNKNCRDLIDLSWERPESILYIFNTLMYVISFANISISILKLNFLNWLYQYLRSRQYESHEILRKSIELFFVHTLDQAGLPQYFAFYNFVRGGGEGKIFITWEYIQFLWFLRLLFLVEVSCF